MKRTSRAFVTRRRRGECRYRYERSKSYYDILVEMADAPPRLPPARFPAPLCDAVAAALSVEPKARPSARELLGGPFIRSHHEAPGGGGGGGAESPSELLVGLAARMLGTWMLQVLNRPAVADGAEGGGGGGAADPLQTTLRSPARDDALLSASVAKMGMRPTSSEQQP
jgi:hypothetical protein